MAQFHLRDIDDRLWARVATRAQVEGWPLKDLVLDLLDGYAGGTIVPAAEAPRPRPAARADGADLHFTCPKCNKAMTVTVRPFSGFGAMTFHGIPCPHCHQVTERALPADLVTVTT